MADRIIIIRLETLRHWGALCLLLCLPALRLQAAETHPLELDSDPSGATVLLNGCLLGATPLRLDGLKTGVYGLRLEKNGFQSVQRPLQVDGSQPRQTIVLPALQTTKLTVKIQPDGAEVLIDGELLGSTPLESATLSAGPHELVIRKTNYEMYSRQIDAPAGQALLYSGFALKDKIEGMLTDQLQTEPQRLAHYIDLGHYYFVNGQMEKSADIYARGFETAYAPLDFNGKEFADGAVVSAEEKDLVKRLRNEDVQRFWSEIHKHMGWNRSDVVLFRTQLKQAATRIIQNNATHWEWAQPVGQTCLQQQADMAVLVYKRFIEVSPQSPHLPYAYLGLMDAALLLNKEPALREAFEPFFAAAQQDGPLLLSCAERLLKKKESNSPLNPTMQLLAEKVLSQALETTLPPDRRAKCLYDLGTLLAEQKRFVEALPFLSKAVHATHDLSQKDDRSLLWASTLLQAKQADEARALYTRLLESKNTKVVTIAQNALKQMGEKGPQ